MWGSGHAHSVGKNRQSDAILVRELEAQRADVIDLLSMLRSIGREHTRPPLSLLLKARQRKGFLESNLSQHDVFVKGGVSGGGSKVRRGGRVQYNSKCRTASLYVRFPLSTPRSLGSGFGTELSKLVDTWNAPPPTTEKHSSIKKQARGSSEAEYRKGAWLHAAADGRGPGTSPHFEGGAEPPGRVGSLQGWGSIRRGEATLRYKMSRLAAVGGSLKY